MRFTILQLFVAFAVVSSIKAMALPEAEDQTDLDDAEWLKMLSEDSSKLCKFLGYLRSVSSHFKASRTLLKKAQIVICPAVKFSGLGIMIF